MQTRATSEPGWAYPTRRSHWVLLEQIEGKDNYCGKNVRCVISGSLRFAHPLPNQPWSDVYEASTQPNACQQTADNTWPGFAGMEQWNPNTNVSEDCLYLNVHAPEKIEDGVRIIRFRKSTCVKKVP